MNCEQRERSGAMIVECFGRFEEEDSKHFIQTLEALIGQGFRNIVINLSSVYYLEPTIGKLLLFSQEFLHEHEGTVSLVSPLSTVRNQLIDDHLSDTIPTFESLYDALHRPHAAYAETAAVKKVASEELRGLTQDRPVRGFHKKIHPDPPVCVK